MRNTSRCQAAAFVATNNYDTPTTKLDAATYEAAHDESRAD